MVRFTQIISGDVQEGRLGELQNWLAANEPKLVAASPEGAVYVGTYFAVYSSEKGMGQLFCIHAMDSYGAQDLLAEPHTPYARLLNELTDFFDQSNRARSGAILLKRVTAATVLGSSS